MKKLLLAILIILLSFSINSQVFLGSNIGASVESGYLVIGLVASFTIGSGDNCPEIKYYETSTDNDTIIVDLFYDISGVWPQLGCNQYDQILIHDFDTSICNLAVVTNIITDLDTIFDADLNTINLCTIGIVGLTQPKLDVDIYPNPFVKTINILNENGNYKKVELFNLQGIKINEYNITNTLDLIDLEFLHSGSYILKFSDKDSVLVKKIIKM